MKNTNKNTMNKLNRLQDFVTELRSTNSVNEKLSIIPNYEDINELLEYTYNPYKMFGVTSKLLKSRNDLVATSTYSNIFDLLDVLYKREVTGHDAIRNVNKFIEDNSEYSELIYNIIDKDLKTRAGVSLLNRVFNNLIPTFKVALANKYEDYEHRVDFKTDTWLSSRKLDGIRVVVRIEDTDITCYSRSGKEFTTLNKVKTEIQNLGINNVVFDGELCIIDSDGNEDFTSAVSQIKRKDYTIENPRYKIFDVLTLEEFDNKTSDRILSDRIDYTFGNSSILDLVEFTKVIDTNHLLELTTDATDNGWEGIMIRKDCEYEGKRTKNLLKCKKFFDAEYKVKSIEVGPFRTINNETGLEQVEDILTNVVIEHKGYEVSVGSGFTIDERRHYTEHPTEIIGHDITVQYFEESKNQNGGISLRFPTVKVIYKTKRDF